MSTAEAFARYANWVADRSPLYARLSQAAADDERLLELAAAAPMGQPEPELLLAAVHALLLEGQDHPLAGFYPTCDRASVDGDPVSHFRDFCLANEDRLRSVISTRRCQTNDVGRSAVLLPAFEHVARTATSDTLVQIEIGTSAGLNLNWDRYRYDFGEVGAVGETESPVTITSEVRGDRRPPLPQEFPAVSHRWGIDLNTLDATDEADARWLHALVHPERKRRHRRLAAAIEVARENRPTLVEGGALEELPDRLSAAPDRAVIVVFSTHVLYQLDEETIATLRSLLSSHSAEQPVHWLSIDPDEGLGEPTYRLVTFANGEATTSQIARFEPYGEWIRWQGT
ncbi:DUF2332 domain-containing protein [Natrononativus amylolyticus]|uniref:DUF2332 domain-containing protein n=1 Tax=Natrononativus amylolyticus TaxID=2963434 RepID=UPI0020CC15D7|nr:DUF2332 domain-containing protein [Natrononativus amylolyticus]